MRKLKKKKNNVEKINGSDNIRPSGQPTENGTMMKIKCIALCVTFMKKK